MVGPAMGAWIKLALIVAAAVACVEPQTEAACEAASLAAGLAIGGGGYEFAGTYHSEGCYAYANGTYTGMAFWSTLRNLNTGLGRRQYRVCEAAIGALASSSGSFSYSFDDDGSYAAAVRPSGPAPQVRCPLRQVAGRDRQLAEPPLGFVLAKRNFAARPKGV